MEAHAVSIRVGQVWKLKDPTRSILTGKVLILSTNAKENKVWVGGLSEMIEPIWDTSYLREHYELLAGWEI